MDKTKVNFLMCFMVRDCLIASDDAALIHYKRETTMFLKIML